MSLNPEVPCWTHVAALTGAQLHVRYIFLGPKQARTRFGLPSLQATLDGVAVHGEVTGEGDPPATFAQLSARAPGSVGLKLRLYRNYLIAQLARGHAADSMNTGSPHFDRNFVLRSSDPSYAKLWLTAKARNAILAAPDYSFEIDAERITATSHYTDDEAQLEAAMHAIAMLANRGKQLTAEVGALAARMGSTFARARAPWLAAEAPEFEFISGGTRVSLTILHGKTGRRSQRRLLSRLWCRRVTARSDRFVFYADPLSRKERPLLVGKLARCHLGEQHPRGYIVHSSDSERLRQRLSERWSKALHRVSPLVISCSEAAVELVCEGAILDEDALRDAAELCEHFAVERRGVISRGPYR